MTALTSWRRRVEREEKEEGEAEERTQGLRERRGGGKRSMCCTCTRLALLGTRAWRRKRRGGAWQRCCAIVWPSSNAIPALSKGPTSE